MANFQLLKFKTLRGRLTFLLVIPVSFILFSGGVLSFLYTRDAMLNQWNESAELKLQRAAHAIEMRLLKPLELLEILFKKSNAEESALNSGQLIAFLRAMEGVIRVDFEGGPEKRDSWDAVKNPMGYMMSSSKMRFSRSMVSAVSTPEYDTDKGQKTVTISVLLFGPNGENMGNLNIQMRFDYLLQDITRMGWWQSDLACIVDQTGKYMVHHTNMTMNDRKFLGDKNDPLEKAILDKMQQVHFGTVKSREHPPKVIAGFYKLEQVPWTIIIFARGEKILSPIINLRNAFALGSLILVFIILMLIRIHVGQLVNYIKLLSDKAQKVAKGEYGKPIPVNREDEIGRLILSHNAMVKGLAERDLIRNSFGRYVDPEFAKILLNRPDAGRLGGKRREVVIMMSDIRGFTALSETLSPELIIRILNQYFSHMIQIVQKHNGIIVDFFGDAILVFFDPLSESMEETSTRCIQCASQMQTQMSAFNQEMGERELPKLAMGIGINAGQVIVGNIGSNTRSKYGIVGSAVNIASRIQAEADKDEIAISHGVYDHVADQVQVKKSFHATLKGVDQPMQLHVIHPLPTRE